MVDYYNELGMTEEMIDEDDLLEDIVVPETQAIQEEIGNEQIEAIAQLGVEELNKASPTGGRQSHGVQNQRSIPKEGRTDQKTQKGLLKTHMNAGAKKGTSSSPDTKGIALLGNWLPWDVCRQRARG